MRLYNPNNGDHLYTAENAEVEDLTSLGWIDEGVKFYGAPVEGNEPIYRLWNSAQTDFGGLGSHLWTADRNEYDTLPTIDPAGSWKQERIVWYVVPL